MSGLLRSKPVAHLRRALARFSNRQGSQFAAAITYFSMLAIAPILMLLFSGLGLTLSLRPDLVDQVKDQVTGALGTATGAEKVKTAIDSWISAWRGVLVAGLATALYAGSAWVSNLKGAVRAQWRPEFEPDNDKKNFVIETLINMATLISLLIVGVLAMAAAQVGTLANQFIVDLLHLQDMPGAGYLIGTASFLLTVVSSWIMFLFVFRVLPQQHAPRRAWLLGSLLAAVGLSVLMILSNVLNGMFSKNSAALLFGPLIVVMLTINIFAQLTLFCAAWIATTNQPAVPRRYNEADAPLKGRLDLEMVDGHWDEAELDRQRIAAKKAGEPMPEEIDASSTSARSAWLRQRAGEIGPDPNDPALSPTAPVPAAVAQQATKIAMRGGYVVGAATGVGIGALIASMLKGKRK